MAQLDVNVSAESLAVELYKLRLGEKISVGIYQQYLRVPGGWIYMNSRGSMDVAVLIPFNNEFQK